MGRQTKKNICSISGGCGGGGCSDGYGGGVGVGAEQKLTVFILYFNVDGASSNVFSADKPSSPFYRPLVILLLFYSALVP